VWLLLPPLLLLLLQIESALEGIRGLRLRQRLRNAAVLLFTDWREVWVQVRAEGGAGLKRRRRMLHGP
jgi:hypothetical protein